MQNHNLILVIQALEMVSTEDIRSDILDSDYRRDLMDTYLGVRMT